MAATMQQVAPATFGEIVRWTGCHPTTLRR